MVFIWNQSTWPKIKYALDGNNGGGLVGYFGGFTRYIECLSLVYCKIWLGTSEFWSIHWFIFSTVLGSESHHPPLCPPSHPTPLWHVRWPVTIDQRTWPYRIQIEKETEKNKKKTYCINDYCIFGIANLNKKYWNGIQKI